MDCWLNLKCRTIDDVEKDATIFKQNEAISSASIIQGASVDGLHMYWPRRQASAAVCVTLWCIVQQGHENC